MFLQNQQHKHNKHTESVLNAAVHQKVSTF